MLQSDLQKQWNNPKIEVVTDAYSIQFCHSILFTSSKMPNSLNNQNVVNVDMMFHMVFLKIPEIHDIFGK